MLRVVRGEERGRVVRGEERGRVVRGEERGSSIPEPYCSDLPDFFGLPKDRFAFVLLPDVKQV